MTKNETGIYGLLYRSQASAPLQDVALRRLVSNARTKNEASDITGVLFYAKPSSQLPGLFAQWLEGPEVPVQSLYAVITNDHRHLHIELLAQGRTHDLVGSDGRLFPDWTMRFEQTRQIPTSLERLLADWLSQRDEASLNRPSPS